MAKVKAIENKSGEGNKISARMIALRWIDVAFIIVALICFLAGAASTFGTSMNPVSAIEHIINIFFIRSGKIYRTLVECAMGVLYVIWVVLIIKALVVALKGVFSRKKFSVSPVDQTTRTINDAALGVFNKILAFIIICGLLCGDGLTSGGWAVVVIGCMFKLGSAALFSFPVGKPGKDGVCVRSSSDMAGYGLSFIIHALIIVFISCFASCLVVPAGTVLVYTVKLIGSGMLGGDGVMEMVHAYIFSPVITIVSVATFLGVVKRAVHWYYQPDGRRTGNDGDFIKSACIFILVLAAVDAVFQCIGIAAGGGSFSLSQSFIGSVFSLLRVRILPVIIYSVFGILLGNIMKDASGY